VRQGAAVDARPEPLPAISRVGGDETILLVEDDQRVRVLVAQMLESYGFDVVPAMSGEDALARTNAGGRFDLLLTDLVMPRFGGREVAAAVRELEPEIAVLFMSGYTDDDVVRRGILDPGTAFVQKPFGSEELAVAVRRLLDEASDRSTGSAVA